MLCNVQYDVFYVLDQECACCCIMPRVWTSFGVHASDRFYEILGHYIAKKTSNPDLTFAEVIACNVFKF